MRFSIKELVNILEQKEKAIYLYNKTGNSFALISALDQMEKYIGKIISNSIIQKGENMDRNYSEGFNGYDDENTEDDYDLFDGFLDDDEDLDDDDLDEFDVDDDENEDDEEEEEDDEEDDEENDDLDEDNWEDEFDIFDEKDKVDEDEENSL